MIYYIVDNEVVEVETAFDGTLYNYDKLNEEQSRFFEQHPTASIQEIVDTQLNEVVVVVPDIPEEPLPLTLEQLKTMRIQMYSDAAFALREAMLPEYKLINAGLPGVYSAEEVINIARVVTAFITEFFRLKALVEQATTIAELEAIEDNYHLIGLE